MTTKEIRKQYDKEDLALMKRLGIDPPDLEDVAESVFDMCSPWRIMPAPLPIIDNEDEEEDESDEEEDESDEEEDEDSPDAFVDLRLKLRRSGYVLNVGSPDFDQDGRGPCGCASIRIDESNDPEKLAEVARALVDDALECAAQYEDGEDIAP